MNTTTRTVLASTLTAGQRFSDGKTIAKVEPGHHCVKVFLTTGSYFMITSSDEVDILA
jgi:hypothetical protein